MIYKVLGDNNSANDPNKDPKLLIFYLAQHAVKIAESAKEDQNNPDENYKLRMIAGIHSLVILELVTRPQINYSGFINLLNNLANRVYRGEILIPFNESCNIPPSDIRKILDRKGLFEILSGYYDIIDSFYSEENKS